MSSYFRLSPSADRGSHHLVDSTCKVSPVLDTRAQSLYHEVERRQDTHERRQDTQDPELRMSSLDTASPSDPGHQGTMSSPHQSVHPILRKG